MPRAEGSSHMAKVKAVARKRRPYEYDHHYGLSLRVGRASNASRGGVSQGGTSPRPTKATKVKKAAKKR
jgi:hypothetical protein